MMTYDHYSRLADARDKAYEARDKAVDAYRVASTVLDILNELLEEVEKEGTKL